MNNDVKKSVDRLSEIKAEQERLKSEEESLQAVLLKEFEAELANTKYKSITIYGEKSAIMLTMADNVNVTHPPYLAKIFGETYGSNVTEELVFKVNAGGKRLLAAVADGEYILSETLEEFLKSLKISENEQKTLLKKLKGINFEKDKKLFKDVCDFDEKAANEYAFLTAEIIIGAEFKTLLALNNSCENVVLDFVKKAVANEKTPKVKVI